MTGWVEARLRKRGVKADRGAVQRLVERVEGNLLAAAQEIDKLVLLADGEPIDAARMESLVADAARFDVFRMLDAALNGQGARTSRMLAGLRAEGQVIPALMGMVVKELLTVATLARVQARGGNMAAEFRAQRVWDSKQRSEEHTSELQSLMRNSYAVFCLKKKQRKKRKKNKT